MTHRIRALTLFSALAILAALLLLPACTPTVPRDPFSYAAAPFSLTVEGTYLPANDLEGIPRPFTARVTAGAPTGGSPILRSLAVTFFSPASLSGLTITATLSPSADGTVTRAVTLTYPTDYGNLQATAQGTEFDGYLRFAEAWLPIGDVTEVSPKAPDGTYTVTRQSGERRAIFTFSDEAIPINVRLTDSRGVIEMRIRNETE